jgi:dipeptidyl aminopeptidase/acylaminoacyl peptidase
MIDSRNRNTSALKLLSIKDGSSSLIAEDNLADIDVLTMHPTEHTIQAVEVNYDKVKYKIIDKSIEKDIEYLRTVEQGDININSRTLDDKLWLIAYGSDTKPVKYYLYNKIKHKATYLFSNNKKLEIDNLSKMHPVIIKSRDGLDLVSYLTLPSEPVSQDEITPKNPLPLVLLVHGGPWARDVWGFNNQHQWLANRGYAVLSVNYRSSTGFGKKFINAGDMEWSKKMHDDLIDAVNWTIDKKIADPKKIAIMGGSYGGYAALVGLTFTPEVFACGIDIVGPSNLLTLIESVPPYWKPILSDFKKRIGSWDTAEQKEFLKNSSPLTYADKINKPLLIAQGQNDPRVKKAEADQIYHAMKNKNIPVLYALYPDEGHGFAKPNNRLSFYAIAEQFLANVLGGQAEAINNDIKGANVILNEVPYKDNIQIDQLISQSTK